MATFLSLTFLPLQASVETKKDPSSLVVPTAEESDAAKALENRLGEIKAMDMENMKAAEKKNMRKEVREIKRELRETSGGVYLSVGAIILIAVLLIVLL